MAGGLWTLPNQYQPARNVQNFAACGRCYGKAIAIARARNSPIVVFHKAGHALQQFHARRVVLVDGVLLQKPKQLPRGRAARHKRGRIVQGIAYLPAHTLQGVVQVAVLDFVVGHATKIAQRRKSRANAQKTKCPPLL